MIAMPLRRHVYVATTACLLAGLVACSKGPAGAGGPAPRRGGGAPPGGGGEGGRPPPKNGWGEEGFVW